MRLRSRSSRPSLVLLLGCACALAVPMLGCNKPAAAVFDAAPPPAVTSAAPAQLAPLDEVDAGVIDAALPPLHHPSGATLTTNQVRARQCCNALRAEAKALGASPEANMLMGMAAQCDAVAMQMGPTKGGTAPELAFLKSLPKLPGLCQGL